MLKIGSECVVMIKIKQIFSRKQKQNLKQKKIITKKQNENEKLLVKKLENENLYLKSEIEMQIRSFNSELLTYLEYFRNILSNVNFDNDIQELSYIKTQINQLLSSKQLKVYIPELNKMHNKDYMIVDSVINTKSIKKDGLVESVLLIGLQTEDGKLVLPTRVRIYQKEDGK